MYPLFISGGELFVVLLVVVMLFGSNKIPELARGLGKGMQEFKKATDEIKREISDTEVSKVVKDIKKDVDNLNFKKDIDNIANNIKS
jgi:sec-independent protein translocase protein TatA